MKLAWEEIHEGSYVAREGAWKLNVWRVYGYEGWRWHWQVRFGRWSADSIDKCREPDSDKAKAMTEMFMLTWKVGYDAVVKALEEREES